MSMDTALRETHIDTLPLIRRGKVRDLYDLGDRLLLVATDRISAYDVVMNDPIPGKGKILTALSAFWFRKVESLFPHHFITCSVEEFPPECLPYKEQLAGRSMIVRKTEPIPIECVVRGYLLGSSWEEYRRTGSVSGVALPPGLQFGDQLPFPLFTPAMKNIDGHDENISFEQLVQHMGQQFAAQLRDISVQLYTFAADFVAQRGLILADTKFEFGRTENGELIIIDELFTPDSSRFWRQCDYANGNRTAFYDKQVLRDYLQSLPDWKKTYPPPPLPEEIIIETAWRYQQLFQMITGIPWEEQRLCF